MSSLASENENNYYSKINILVKSPIIAEMVKNGEIGIVGGVHDISSGEVKFFD